MTLSIIATDVEAGVIGCAVTSCAVAAGRRVLHIRTGVGAAVAQASASLRWGEDLLDAVASGRAPDEAVADLANAENQLAVVTSDGRVAAHTGDACVSFAGHSVGAAVSAQANMAAGPDAWQRMLDAFAATDGPLAERLVAALAASGGDKRGQQGAAVLVTSTRLGEELAGWWYEPHVDLRVDDHREPVGELERLLSLHRAHSEMRRIAVDPPGEQLPILESLLACHPQDPHLLRVTSEVLSRT